MNDPNDIDPEHKLIARPMELTESDREALKLKFGEAGFYSRYQNAINNALRRIQVAPPYKTRR